MFLNKIVQILFYGNIMHPTAVKDTFQSLQFLKNFDIFLYISKFYGFRSGIFLGIDSVARLFITQ